MFKIGDFSKLSRVSIKALRLYNQLGLLKPAQVDHFTGYRYYSAEQLSCLNRILALKDLGFSLGQIGHILSDPLPSAQLQGMLRLRQAELQEAIVAETSRLERVAARLKQIEQEDAMSDYEVVLKPVEAMQVVSIREILPNYQGVGQLFEELLDCLKQEDVEPGYYWSAIWHDSEYKPQDVDGEAVISITSAVKGNDRVQVKTLLGQDTMACLVHHGSYKTLETAYREALKWIEANSYQIVDSNRELYIEGGPEQDNESYVTELQFPVAKL